ncbi:MAG: XamI family restriction endonuclease [Candidatus Thiosymbion ectosymbiont of Robbea hypermnestra]|nr:XamI family restriction endonuclease [Candidatus Thiosymbion ectosymbiont of Robbea hypermnestra]
MAINADKPRLWKSDVEKSIDFYNDWFLRFAPQTYRMQRAKTTGDVTQALTHTEFLRAITPDRLTTTPGVLPMLRMMCAPPIARDRLIGLAHVSKNLVFAMEGRLDRPSRIPPRMSTMDRDEQLARICETIIELVDPDLFSWLETGQHPSEGEIARAASVVADRLCGATADPLIRNAQERRQLESIQKWLELREYRYLPPNSVDDARRLPPSSFTFRLNITVESGRREVKVPVDCVIQPACAQKGSVPILIEAKSAGDATNTNKRRKEEAQKYNQLKTEFGRDVQYVLFLCGYFEPGYLGYEASEGIDWIWEHRINDLAILLQEPKHSTHRIEERRGTYATPTELRERKRFERQKAIDDRRTQEERNRRGQFSTPFDLAQDIVTNSLRFHDNHDIYFLEPALGTGVFFGAMEERVDKTRIKQASGIEFDAGYSSVADELWSSAPFTVINQDFFEFTQLSKNRGTFSLLCTNPPYVRHHHIPSAAKSLLQDRVRSELDLNPSGLSGLYVYFILLSHQLLAPNAVASWLIPSEFLSVNYGRVLREYLLRRVTLIHIHQFDPTDVQFDDALVSSCVVTYKNTPSSDSQGFTFSYGGSLANPKRKRRLVPEDMPPEQKWHVWDIPSQDSPDINGCPTLLDVFDIRRGIATGANGFFIIDHETASQHKIPRRFLRPILPSPRHIKTTVIENDDIGLPSVPKVCYLLDCTLPPELVRKKHPTLWQYLESGHSEGISGKYLCSNRKFWYQQERREPALFMATYMGRSHSPDEHPFRFFLNLSDAIATNVFLMLYPKPDVQLLLGKDRNRMEELLDCLNSLKKQVLINAGRTYGGGLHKLEPRELASLPIPRLPKWLRTQKQTELIFS